MAQAERSTIDMYKYNTIQCNNYSWKCSWNEDPSLQYSTS